MNTEQLLLTKWQYLDSEKQAQVLDFIDNLNKNNQKDNSILKKYQPKTELGKKLWAIRQEMLKKSDVKLLDLDDIEVEINQMRGK
ncbi:hypothetical protein [Geminocystis herdmanii]|uniref:hypothetical protein n=1 Tax=Geminocystis herdmanii TaxID=669359 RepID=UPI00034D6D78|nr:hypothetical protein [Geminocystis herdmanii]